jgi:hypothetical protein
MIDSDWGWFPSTSGVQVRDFRPFLKYPDRIKIIDLPFTEEENEEILRVAMSYVGKASYDLPLLASFFWEWFEGDIAFENMAHMEDGFTCSEFISYCINKVTSHVIIPGRHIHSIRPHELELLDGRP